MRAKIRPLVVLALAAALGSGTQAASAQGVAAEHPPVGGAGPPSISGPGWGPEETAPPLTENSVEAELPILYVTSVEILKTSAQPELDIVRVTGLASSEGWSTPQLVPTYAGKPFDGILDLELIATPPEQSEAAEGFVPVDAILTIQPGEALAGVRVRGSENAITVRQVPGMGKAAISVIDCHSCTGQKFAPEGVMAQSQQGVVRQEELPKALRIIKAGDGIRGMEHDPNRLSLILGEDGTILEAFWE